MRCCIVQENWSRENANIKSLESQRLNFLGYYTGRNYIPCISTSCLYSRGLQLSVKQDSVRKYILIFIFLDLYVQVIFIVPLTSKIICKLLYKVYYEECLWGPSYPIMLNVNRMKN